MAHHHHSHNHNHNHDDHGHSLYGELMCHLPHAIFSVAFSLMILTLVTYFSAGLMQPRAACQGAHMLFHAFHFMHIVFAATGTVVTFCRFSRNVWKMLIVGTICPIVFCAMSDIIIPYIAGRLLGVAMHFHVCFYSELANVLPFLVMGIINGYAMSRHPAAQRSHATVSHISHIFVSSLASSFYLVSHGFTDWYLQIGLVFVFLVIAVVVPCTLSDVIVPIFFAKAGNKDEKHQV